MVTFYFFNGADKSGNPVVLTARCYSCDVCLTVVGAAVRVVCNAAGE